MSQATERSIKVALREKKTAAMVLKTGDSEKFEDVLQLWHRHSSSACGISPTKERGGGEGAEGKLISAHDSELIVRLWHTGPGLVSATDG